MQNPIHTSTVLRKKCILQRKVYVILFSIIHKKRMEIHEFVCTLGMEFFYSHICHQLFKLKKNMVFLISNM